VGTFWFHCLSILASWDILWLIVINEAHFIAQDGCNFWPEFHLVVKNLKVLYDNQPTKCNCIAMLATFRQLDQAVIMGLLKRALDQVIWLELSRRGIQFDVVVSGSPSLLITQSVSLDYKYKTDMKAIIYTNSKQQALGGITSVMESVINRSRNNGKVIPLTGNDGLQFKVFTMHAFADDSSNPMLPNL
jgi:superfamily II DNA helicase RecQ